MNSFFSKMVIALLLLQCTHSSYFANTISPVTDKETIIVDGSDIIYIDGKPTTFNEIIQIFNNSSDSDDLSFTNYFFTLKGIKYSVSIIILIELLLNALSSGKPWNKNESLIKPALTTTVKTIVWGGKTFNEKNTTNLKEGNCSERIFRVNNDDFNFPEKGNFFISLRNQENKRILYTYSFETKEETTTLLLITGDPVNHSDIQEDDCNNPFSNSYNRDILLITKIRN